MKVYHGGVCEIRLPDISHSKSRLDFGKAFYVTTYRKQAEKWARRKSARKRMTPIVNEYDLAPDMRGFNVKRFLHSNREWLDFVCACRDAKRVLPDVDVIIGRVANDDVFKTIDSYLNGDITKTVAIQRLRYAKPNDQIAIRTNKAIKSLLTFKKSYTLSRENNDKGVRR